MPSDSLDDQIIKEEPNGEHQQNYQHQQQAQNHIADKAHDLMLKGRQLNNQSNDHYNHEAFNILSKAIKLNPHLLEAWIELTKCYQKKRDIEGAIACLENALKYCDSDKPNKIILRKLSTCIRQKNCESQEAKITTLLKSLHLSKQALKCDLNDEENYYNLAKAYLCLFFATECVDQQLINLSKAAYVKALALSEEAHRDKEKTKKLTKETNGNNNGIIGNNHNSDKKQESIIETDKHNNTNQSVSSSSSSLNFDESQIPFMEQSDFLFNFSTVLVYLQEFQKAIEYLRIAIKLDKEWDEPKNLEECLVDYVKQIYLMMNEFARNSRKVVKKYSKIVEKLKDTDKIEQIIEMDQQRLKKSLDVKVKSIDLNYLGVNGSNNQNETKTNSDSNHIINNNSTKSAIFDANSDSNVVKLLHLKLVSTINYNQAMYLTFVAVDHNYAFIVLTIYNLAASRCPSSRDVITIVEPKIEEIKVDNLINLTPQQQTQPANQTISYKRISVREFKSLYVNGFRITSDQVSKPQFKVSILP